MTRSMTQTRRAARLGVAAVVGAVALSGCGTGQLAETVNKEPSVYGVNTQSPDGSVLIRGLAVTYRDPEGYPAGASAPLELALYNETASPVTVRIASAPAAGAGATVVSGRNVTLSGAPDPGASATGIPAEAEPSGSPEPASPATPGAAGEPTPGAEGGPTPQATAAGSGVDPSTEPTGGADTGRPPPAPAPGRLAEITIPPLSSAIFLPGGTQTLRVNGLSGPLRSGMSVNLLFQFNPGTEPVAVAVPVGVPLSPAPRGSAHNEGVEGGTGEH